jgi:hypothetical protein
MNQVGRNKMEYAIPIGWLILCILNLVTNVIIDKMEGYHLYYAIIWMILFLIYAVVLIYKIAVPIMRGDGRFIVVFSKLFTKRIVDPQDIKAVKAYSYLKKTITTPTQAKRNNTPIIELKNGEVLALSLLFSESMRNEVAVFFQNYGLTLEVMKAE